MSTQRKPRIALMGEFSAGKSTLANLLLGQASSPVQVTATQLPPVWYKHGAIGASRVTMEGAREKMMLEDWAQVTPADTQMVEMHLQASFLETFELIDMPGTSDPNMVPDFWGQFLPQVDLVIWCTPANQAWRQSEAALWEMVEPRLWETSLLLVTRMDKIQSERDRRRILQRIVGEAGPYFRQVLPISLLAALSGGEDAEALNATGAADLMTFLESAATGSSLSDMPDFEPKAAPEPAPVVEEVAPAQPSESAIIPRRIVRRRAPTLQRPEMGSS